MISVSDWTNKPLLSNVQFGPFSILYSQFGDFDPLMFEKGLNLLLTFAIPAANATKSERLLPAIPIVDLSTITVAVHNDFMRIEAYPHYKSEEQHYKGRQEVSEREERRRYKLLRIRF